MVAAGNRGGDQAVTTTMSSALANRFCHIEMEPELDDWLRWAQGTGIHPVVIGFLRFCPDRFHDMSGVVELGWPSARSWERVSHLMYRLKLDEVVLVLMTGRRVACGRSGLFVA